MARLETGGTFNLKTKAARALAARVYMYQCCYMKLLFTGALGNYS